MPVENTDGLRWSKAKFPKDPFRLLLCLRFNARVDDCSFHCIIVSLLQHRCKVFFLISIFSSFVQHLLYIAASYRKEVSENQGSSLLNNIFSTILNLAPLQIRNSPPAADQTAEFAVVPLDKNCYRKNLQFALGTLVLTFSDPPQKILDKILWNI